MALNSLKTNKTRAILTMLGIIIGISAVIAITTLGNIMSKTVTDAYAGLGANMVQFYLNYKDNNVRDYINDDEYIDNDIIEAIENKFGDRITNIALTDGAGAATTRFKHEDLQLNLSGANADYLDMSMTKILHGRYISENDVQKRKQVCVISDKQSEKLFGMQDPIGKTITINYNGTYYDFSVIGVYEYQMSSLMSAMGSAMGADWNAEVTIPVSTAQEMKYGPSWVNMYTTFSINGAAEEDENKLAKEITDFLNNSFYRNSDSFEVQYMTAQQQMDMFTTMLSTVSIVISIIAGISLIVGGVGVMNIMLVSVTERTREIGVRKALGAPNNSIRMQFITESLIICLIGGIIGIILGLILGSVAGLIVGTVAPPSISGIILAVTFSLAIGVFFGYYPANKAAKLNPIDALRYE